MDPEGRKLRGTALRVGLQGTRLDSGRKGKNFRERTKLQASGESGKEGECTVRGAWVHLHSVTDSLRNLLVRFADVIQWEGDSWAGSLGASDEGTSPNRPHPLWDTAPPPGRAARVNHSQGSRDPHHAHHGSLVLPIMLIMDRLLWS